jgi:uncharacterized phage-associated protein
MNARFDQAKAAQLAGLFLQMRGGRMHYMKLIKLMYLADREALIRGGQPITNDAYFSMPHGPILSATLDLINEGPDDGSPWHQVIERSTDPYSVRLKSRPSIDMLSEDEREVATKVFEKYGQMNRYKLRDLLHKILPEWQDPQGSSLRITYRDILLAEGKSEPEVAQILSEIKKDSA